ncbi:PQQ-dependent dehydrogenase, methanol/ethanol family [Alteromonas confluentis]|uniref:Cytochrome c domain-containing protein n=1 Tax=Alteromonas confluentis TaxID=1656094 RepID=A0A1E7Z7V3_9ALTE|nr:PQQ-dependent dehydrogenase, methanol/ethanol family [Alteromonas confluentis]OFC69629.1 hypothetical protein BFC18_16265 [Alteromonas confluentis]
MHSRLILAGLIISYIVTPCRAQEAITSETLVNADSNDSAWLSYGKNYSETRFSPLTQINQKNIGQLKLLNKTLLPDWRGMEATPLLIDGVLYVTGPWSKVFAIDAVSGELLWSYDPQVSGQTAINGCCDVVNRGLAAWDDKLYLGSFDGRLIALNRQSGKVSWETNTVPEDRPYTITGAPRVINGAVLIGNGGAELGVRGYFSSYDASTGKLNWRFYTVPGNPDEGFENAALKDAAKTWTGEWWKVGGGGTVWDSMAYDPELDLLYVGTGNGSPWDRNHRSPEGGDNLYLSSILAVRPSNGELVWHYQTTPGDSWDFTASQHIILADIEIDGKQRSVLMQAPKNGYFYVLDRKTGELLKADPFTYVNWSTGIDLKTGRPVETEFARYENINAEIAPNYDGGHNWHPMAYDPNRELVFIPGRNTLSMYGRDLNWKYNSQGFGTGAGWNLAIGQQDNKADRKDAAAPVKRGFLKAWNPKKGQAVWTVEQDEFWNGGLLATAGGVVFQGTADGRLTAYNSETGELVFSTETGIGILAPPITYQINGVQYVTVAAGWGGGFGMKNLFTNKLRSNAVLTFALQNESNPSVNIVNEIVAKEFNRFTPADSQVVPDLSWQVSRPLFEAGERLFDSHCAVCHVVDDSRGGIAPNLLSSLMTAEEPLSAIILHGALQSRGMPSFVNKLDKSDAQALSHYLRSLQNKKKPGK